MQELKQPVQDKCKKLIIIALRKYYWCACVFVEGKPAYLIIIINIIIGIAGFICAVTSKITAVVVNK